MWLTSDRNYWAHGSEWPGTCPEEIDLYRHEPLRSAVFQLPIEGNSVRAARTIGSPYDQIAFDERKDRLPALLVREPDGCFLFSLSGSELIKGTLLSGKLAEVGRLQLTGSPERH